MASACTFLLENYDDDAPINVDWGRDIPIAELATMIGQITGYVGSIEWDSTKLDGTPRKMLDTQLINSLGWKPSISLWDGIASTYQWYQANL